MTDQPTKGRGGRLQGFEVDEVSDLETTFGAVALIDVLGFKQVRREYDHRQVMRALVSARDTLRAIESHLDSSEKHKLRLACFSDTIVATVEAGPDIESAVVVLARTLMVFLHRAISDPHRIPMVYRGCVTVGEFAAGGEFFVGPAIDDAAEWHERSDAAIVWLTPRAAKVIERHDLGLLRWSVELKAIGPLETLAVSLAPPGALGERGEVITSIELQAQYARPFDLGAPEVRPEVLVKKQLTMAFVAAAHAHSTQWRADGTQSEEQQ